MRKYGFIVTDSLRRRFARHIDKTPGHGPDGECWVWTGTSRGVGYGAFKVRQGLVMDSHRLAWLIAHDTDELPAGIQVCHRCDNRACVRVSHLFIGTRSDNMRDCAAKGRLNSTCGESHPTATLTEDMIREGRRRFVNGETYKSLALEFGVDRSALRKAMRGEAWKHVTDPPPVSRYSRPDNALRRTA